MAKMLDCVLEVNKFEFLLRYYVHCRTDTIGKGMNPFYTLAKG